MEFMRVSVLSRWQGPGLLRSAGWPGIVAAGAALLYLAGCAKTTSVEGGKGSAGSRCDVLPGSTILLAQAQFEKVIDGRGKVRSKPGAARLLILRCIDGHWRHEFLEDPESNVFHKAVFHELLPSPDAQRGILTIGANAAILKYWLYQDGTWRANTLWRTVFGGKQDRLRDFELGDVDGDRRLDIVVVTHDQGVVAVLNQAADRWEPVELDRRPNTFVHEVELGDLDGDGLAEIFTTPSEPNLFDGSHQPGDIVAYRHAAGAFHRQVVEHFDYRHVKEVLAADLEGRGQTALYASLEAELGRRADAPPDAQEVLIRKYTFTGGAYVGENIASLPDGLCRFLNAGDVDGDGRQELVASTHKQGIWLLDRQNEEWVVTLIDRESSGFEHATALSDLDADGVAEIYVAADDQQQVRCYTWRSGGWVREDLADLVGDAITFGIDASRPAARVADSSAGVVRNVETRDGSRP